MKNDKIVQYTSLIAIILAMLHFRQSVYSQRTEALIRFCFCIFYPLLVGCLGRKSIPIFFILFSFPLSWINSFNNYTSFMIIMLSSYFYSKRNKELIICYCINESVALMFNHCAISHFVIHFLNCFCIYYMFTLFKKNINVKPLKLTETEVKILREMINGKAPKEIDIYSTNTVYKSIQDAKKRNGCISTAELLFRFKETITEY